MTDINKIKDNCFALPKGINWCPMDVALKTLEENLNTVCQKKKISSITSEGCILAKPINAEVSNPNFSNSAVDGFGFGGPAFEGLNKFSLISGTAFAGTPFGEEVPEFQANELMTGAALPPGPDKII